VPQNSIEWRAVSGTKSELLGQFHRPPWAPSERSLKYATLLQEISAALEYPQVQAVSGSASDGNNTAAIGIPTLDGFGPTGGRHHSPDEFVDVSSFPRKAAALAGLLAEIGTPEAKTTLRQAPTTKTRRHR
jgi:glutamate carboxypeptidase